MFASILRTQARTALASWRTISPIISQHAIRRSLQLPLLKSLSRPLSTFRVLRNEGPEESVGRGEFQSIHHPSDTLYVGNIPFNVEADEIREPFTAYGTVVDVRIRAPFSLAFFSSLF